MVKEDLIRAYEDGWTTKRLFQPEAKRGRVKFEGQNVASYVAKSKEIATWLIQQKELKIKIEGYKEYSVSFKPRLPKHEMQVLRMQEVETRFWIMALRVPLGAYYFLGSDVVGLFGIREEEEHQKIWVSTGVGGRSGKLQEDMHKTPESSQSRIRWGSECCEEDLRANYKSVESSSMESSAGSGLRRKKETGCSSRRGLEKSQRAIALERNQMETVERSLVPVLCTSLEEGVSLLSLTNVEGAPQIPSKVIDSTPSPAIIMEVVRELYGIYVPVRLISRSTMAQVIVETVQGYNKLYFPILDARIPSEVVATMDQTRVRRFKVDLLTVLRERNWHELENIQIIPEVSAMVLVNANEKLLVEDNFFLSSFLANSLTEDWRSSSRVSSSREVLKSAPRILNPNDPGYSWFSNLHRDRQDITRRRLDYFMLSEPVLERIVMVKQAGHPMSDHKPVVTDIRLRLGVERGRGFFRLNSHVLEDPGILDVISRILARARNRKEAECIRRIEEAEEKMEGNPISARVWAA
ncbi:hypothetical protein CBR_g29822 [Chara braunii]|uniref:Endonuclease/exonuclease/phosphatase domain-containing protein n=1 Tax=Chara braunii TaxID=69332 RepID=A0A388JWM6_CHABU|nr:hypothetical protein CBR_g29822 [Chara braunii]|eukprot:GBG62214.1 hypothetical protein CBR_g29822 [Chara braunii]